MMVEIYNLMNKRESKLTKLESTKLSKMAIAAELYEDSILGLKPLKETATIPELVELKLFEYKMTQARLADEIGLAKSKVSEILNRNSQNIEDRCRTFIRNCIKLQIKF